MEFVLKDNAWEIICILITKMLSRYNKIIILSSLLVIAVMFLLYPIKIYASLGFMQSRNFFGKKINFIVKNSNTGPQTMGPIIGPVAVDVFTQNKNSELLISKIFERLNDANRVIRISEEQERLHRDVKKMYSESADYLRNKIEEIKIAEKYLQDILERKSIDNNFNNKIFNTEYIVESYSRVIDGFESAADEVSLKDVVMMINYNIIKEAVGQAVNAVVYDTSGELVDLVNYEIFNKINLSEQSEIDGILGMMIRDDVKIIVDSIDNGGKIDSFKLSEMVKEKLKEKIKTNDKYLRDNFQREIKVVIAETVKEINNIDELNYKDDDLVESEEEAVDFIINENSTSTDNSKGEQCLPGYVLDKDIYHQCIQKDCDNINFAEYNDGGECVCKQMAFSDEEESKTYMECLYSQDFNECSRCVYACIKIGEKCPNIN